MTDKLMSMKKDVVAEIDAQEGAPRKRGPYGKSRFRFQTETLPAPSNPERTGQKSII